MLSLAFPAPVFLCISVRRDLDQSLVLMDVTPASYGRMRSSSAFPKKHRRASRERFAGRRCEAHLPKPLAERLHRTLRWSKQRSDAAAKQETFLERHPRA